MFKASDESRMNYDTFAEMIREFGWSGEDVLNYLTDWHGMDLLSKEFIQNLIDCEL